MSDLISSMLAQVDILDGLHGVCAEDVFHAKQEATKQQLFTDINRLGTITVAEQEKSFSKSRRLKPLQQSGRKVS